MKTQDLIDLGIEDEAVQKELLKLHGKGIEALKASSTDAEAKVATLTEQLETANKTIEDFKEMDIEGIQEAADKYKADLEEAQRVAAEEMAQVKFDHALEKALNAAGSKNQKSVRALLKIEELTLDEDGLIEGLDLQLEEIKKENDFLFTSKTEEEPAGPRIVAGARSGSVISDSVVDAAREAAGIKH